MKKSEYVTKVNLIETVTVNVNRGGYREKLVPYDLKIYETFEATDHNNDITQKPLKGMLKKLGYVSKYVMTQYGIRQRLVKNED